jgi:hypothetical protein
VILDAHGIRVELPSGWSGRLFWRDGGAARLHAASYPVALSDGEFGDASTRAMPATGAAFVALLEYLPGAGLKPGSGLFSSRRIPRPLDPTAFAANRMAHPRPGQVGAQHFFTASGRAFCLYVVIAGVRLERRAQLAHVDHVLGTLQIDRRNSSSGALT